MDKPRFSEEIILSVSKTTLVNARNNQVALSEFGMTEDKLNQFEINIQTAEALPGEKQNKITLKGFTFNKDKALKACYQWGQKLYLRLELAFGKDSFQCKSFPSKDFNKAESSENAMKTVMKVLISIADQYKTELANFGQTAEKLAMGSELLNLLRVTDSTQELNKDEKKMATKDRNQQYINLYDMVNEINRIGRIVFKNDPVKLALFQSKWPKSKPKDSEETE